MRMPIWRNWRILARLPAAGGIPTVSSARCTISIRHALSWSISASAFRASASSMWGVAADCSARPWPDAARRLPASTCQPKCWISRVCICWNQDPCRSPICMYRRKTSRKAHPAALMPSPAWNCWNTCPILHRSLPPARGWSNRAAASSCQPSTARRALSLPPSSVPNT